MLIACAAIRTRKFFLVFFLVFHFQTVWLRLRPSEAQVRQQTGAPGPLWAPGPPRLRGPVLGPRWGPVVSASLCETAEMKPEKGALPPVPPVVSILASGRTAGGQARLILFQQKLGSQETTSSLCLTTSVLSCPVCYQGTRTLVSRKKIHVYQVHGGR